MGNCLRREKPSSQTWPDVDEHWEWGSLGSTPMNGDDGEKINVKADKEEIVGGKRDTNSREVKIKIPKKELEELVHMQGFSLEQVILAKMLNGGEDVLEFEQPRSWKPMLQSIPEVN